MALTAAGIDNARFEARLLMAQASGLSTEQLIARGRDPAPAPAVETLRSLTARRVKREPMAYILGEREFWGLPFKVSPAVLVPRPDSETMIEAALLLQPDRSRPWRLLDLGLGSGCLLLTLLKEVPHATGLGLEASPAALAVAQANAEALGVADRATLVSGDWREPDWTDRLAGPFDLIVSNPPYISPGDPHLAALRHEPLNALVSQDGGLADIRRIVSQALAHLKPGGWLLFEHGHDQFERVQASLAQWGYTQIQTRPDLAGIPRCTGAQSPNME